MKVFLLVLVSCFLASPLQAEVDLMPLSGEDAKKYQDIFALQEKGKWKRADRLIKKIDDKILLGHIYYQRYMHPTKYRSKYSELANWMLKYADHPGAGRIYSLAKKKNGGTARRLHHPVPLIAQSFPARKPLPPTEVVRTIVIPDPEVARPGVRLKRQDRRDIAAVKKRIKRYLRRKKPDWAEKRLWAFEKRGLLTNRQIDEQIAKIASGYYFANQDLKAFALARYAARRSRHDLSQADWVAGLAAWRLGDCTAAEEHFEQVANSPVAGDWTAAAGAYWAARASIVCHEPEKVRQFLLKAASFHRTFYGLIAAHQLGYSPDLNWTIPDFTDRDFRTLKNIAGVQRTIALAQVGKYTLADMELSNSWKRTSGDKHDSLLGLAASLSLPSTQLKIGKIEEQKRLTALDSTLYPLPRLEPVGGFTLDRALIFAVMRQESEFNSWARSSVGARGLMQLMPRTASFIERDRSLRFGSRIKLDDPRYNMALGQKYMKTMLGADYANGNLFKSLTAYNAGPGNLRKWVRKTNFQDDALLFIESIPARETRIYIERVISNYWIYRLQLGQDIPSLESVAAGDWPLYKAQDSNLNESKQHAHR